MSSQMPGVILPPPGTIYIASVQYLLSFLLIAAMMNSFIISILLVMFIFSTTSLRRRPVFILNVITLCLALLWGVFSMYNEIHTMLSPDVPQSPVVLLSFIILQYFGAMMAEATMMLRLLAVYPFKLTPRVRFVAIIAVPVVIKIARIINFSLSFANYAPILEGFDPALAVAAAYRTWSYKFDWILQCVDNGFVSIMFLRRLRTHVKPSKGAILHRAVVRRLRSLFVIAVSNFVFPVTLNIIQLGLSIGSSNYTQMSLVVVVNSYVIVIGVVFATIWASGTQYFESQQEEESGAFTLPTFQGRSTPERQTTHSHVLSCELPSDAVAIGGTQRGHEKPPMSFFDFPQGRNTT